MVTSAFYQLNQKIIGFTIRFALLTGTIFFAIHFAWLGNAAFGFDESLRMEFKMRKMNIRTTVICPYFINTGMFEGVKTRFPQLLPILEEDVVAKKIVKAIESDKARLIMPGLVYSSWVMRYLPVSMFDWVSSFLGVSTAMDDFIGRDDKAPA